MEEEMVEQMTEPAEEISQPEAGEGEQEAAPGEQREEGLQSPEENSRYAAIRRRAEREARRKAGLEAQRPQEPFQLEQAAERAREKAITQRINGELEKISRLDPSVRSLEDLAKSPACREVYTLLERGYELEDAYKLANFDALTQRAAQANRQATLNSMSGKNHLSQSRFRGQGGAPVPPEVAREYRLLVPDATDSEIYRHYNKYCFD